MTLTSGILAQYSSASGVTNGNVATFSVSQGVVAWNQNIGMGNTYRARVVNYDSALIITGFGTEITLPTNNIGNEDKIRVVALSPNVAAYVYANSLSRIKIILTSLTGSILSAGSEFDLGVNNALTGSQLPFIVPISTTKFVLFYGDNNNSDIRGQIFQYVGNSISGNGIATQLSTLKGTNIVSASLSPTDFVLSFNDSSSGFGKQLVAIVTGLSIVSGSTTEFVGSILDSDSISLGSVDTTHVIRSYTVTGDLFANIDLLSVAGTIITLDDNKQPTDNSGLLSANSDVLAIVGNPVLAAFEIVITPPTITPGVTQSPAPVSSFAVEAIDTQRALYESSLGADVYIISSDISPVITDWELSQSPLGIPGRDTT